MNINKFLNEYKRMCMNYNGCKGCQFEESDCIDSDELEELIEKVEKWSNEHPKKTNGQVMLDYIQKFVNDTDGGFTSLTMSPRIVLEFDQNWWCKEYKE